MNYIYICKLNRMYIIIIVCYKFAFIDNMKIINFEYWHNLAHRFFAIWFNK